MGVPVLHVYSDYKWTGPSEPVAYLVHELCARSWPSRLLCARAPEGRPAQLADRAREMGVEVDDSLRLSASLNPARNVAQMRRLRAVIHANDYGLVHCHGSWDHFLAAWALGRGRQLPLVRSDHGGRVYGRRLPSRWFYGERMADRLLVLSDRFRSQAVDALGRSPESVVTVQGAVDAEAFAPREVQDGIRERFGFQEEDFLLGIVARVQPHRRFDVLLEAARRVRQFNSDIKILVLGRGTRKKVLLDDPVRELGLEDTVFPLGYVREGYGDVLAMLDAGMMLVPGSDASCRAAMQMAAIGKPLLVAERGVLPDIVLDGKTGLVVKDTPENLASAMLSLVARSPEERREWGVAGRRRMCEVFSLERQVTDVVSVYESLVDG